MKTYEEVIARMAKSMWNNHMSGGSKYYTVGDQFGIVGFIFDVPEDQVRADANEVFRKLNNGVD